MENRGETNLNASYIRWFSQLNNESISVIGSKAAYLAHLSNNKFPVPQGFVLTSKAFNKFIEYNNIKEEINKILDLININDLDDLDNKSRTIIRLILNSQFPHELINEIHESYQDLSFDKSNLQIASKYAMNILKNTNEQTFVAVRPSAISDNSNLSFAGVHETYTNIKGNSDLTDAIKKIYASLYLPRSIFYRKINNEENYNIAVIVQKMVDPERAGVIYSENPINNDKSIVIESIYGLGEGLTSGKINPDYYQLTKSLQIKNKIISNKKTAYVRDSQGESQEVRLIDEVSTQSTLTDSQIHSLANYAIRIQEFLSFPAYIEFAIESNEISILQAQQLSESNQTKNNIELNISPLFNTNYKTSPFVNSGKVKIISEISQLNNLPKDSIIITNLPDKDLIISQIISNGMIKLSGGMSSYCARIAREFNKPLITQVDLSYIEIDNEHNLTLDGINGNVYEGNLLKENIQTIKPIIPDFSSKLKIKLSIDNPQKSFLALQTGINQAGIINLEELISSTGSHPLNFIQEDKLDSYKKLLISGIEESAQNLQELWIKLPNFSESEHTLLKSNPSKNDANPKLGIHGIRFSLFNTPVLQTELEVIKELSQIYQDKLFGILLPYVTSSQEIKMFNAFANQIGLFPSDNIKLGIVIQTPSSCLIIKNLIRENIEYVHIDLPSLTQNLLSVDFNNQTTSSQKFDYLSNLNHEAVLNAIKRVIRSCKELGVESSISGVNPQNILLINYLIDNDIDSICINPNMAYELSNEIYQIEQKKLSENNLNENIVNKDQINIEEKFDDAIVSLNEELSKNSEVIKENTNENENENNDDKISEDLNENINEKYQLTLETNEREQVINENNQSSENENNEERALENNDEDEEFLNIF